MSALAWYGKSRIYGNLILVDIIKMSIIILSFVTECYMMEVLSSKMHQNVIHKYIYCLKVPRSQSSTGRCTETRMSQLKLR